LLVSTAADARMVAMEASATRSARAGPQDRPIDPGRPIALYLQLKTLLLEEILSGRYGTDQRLPTEHALCSEHAISRTPVHRALAELAAEGVILRHRRRGSFVNPHWLRRNARSPELRVIVPEGPWGDLLGKASGDTANLSIATVDLRDLHHSVVHAVAEGRAPDIAVIDSVWVREFAAAGFLWPLAELAPAWVRDEYEPDVLEPFAEANTFDGSLVAVQAEADVAGLWYRRSVLDDLGLGVPRSWDELADAATAIAASDLPAPVVLPGGSAAGEATTYCLLALLASNGVSVIDDGDVTLDCQGTVELLGFLRGLVQNGTVATEVVAYTADRPIKLLATGGAAFCFGGSYEAPALQEAAGIAVDDVWATFGFAPIPRGPRGGFDTLAGGMVHVVFRQAANPRLALQLIANAVAPSALAEMSTSTGQLPSRRSAIALVAGSSPFLQETAAMLERATVRPVTASYPRVSAQLQSMLEAALVGRLQPEDAASRTADMIGAITGLEIRR
jgi:multiple sugar transport system substrate-binding protein